MIFGPITCGVVVTKGFRDYRTGIYKEYLDKSIQTTHEVSIVGWNTNIETNSKYWIIRNSWGTWWGHYGYMYLEIGSLNIE